MKHMIRYKKPFSAFLVCVLLFSCLFSTRAFAESVEEQKEIDVVFNISSTQISFVVTEKLTVNNGDGSTSELSYEPLVVDNTGYIGIKLDSIKFTEKQEDTLVADTQDFKNMDAGLNRFSLVGKYGENNSQTNDFSSSDTISPAVTLKSKQKFTLTLTGQTAPQYEAISDRELGSFVVTISQLS